MLRFHLLKSTSVDPESGYETASTYLQDVRPHSSRSFHYAALRSAMTDCYLFMRLKHFNLMTRLRHTYRHNGLKCHGEARITSMLLREVSTYSLFSLYLLHRITDAGDELEAILLESIGWIIDEVIEKGEINRQPLINRQRQGHTSVRRISIGIVP